MSKIAVESNRGGTTGRVLLDGKPVPDVGAVSIHIQVGEPIVATISLQPHEVVFEGDVEKLIYVGLNGRRLVEEQQWATVKPLTEVKPVFCECDRHKHGKTVNNDPAYRCVECGLMVPTL